MKRKFIFPHRFGKLIYKSKFVGSKVLTGIIIFQLLRTLLFPTTFDIVILLLLVFVWILFI